MGCLRLFLAFLVLISHMGYTWHGYNPGVMAVAVFYLLAGHVVAKLWLHAPAERRLQWFARDRAWRILPQYYLSLVVAAAMWYWLQPDSYHVSATPTIFDWFANLTIVPLNYFMFNGTDQFTLLAPAWSLGAEIQFYFLVPVLLLSRNILFMALALSLGVFSFAQTGLINPDIYGYRLLPGILFLFICGALCIQPQRTTRTLLVLLWLIGCVYVAYLSLQPTNPPYVFEVALGFIVGLPCVVWGSRPSVRPQWWRVVQQRAGVYSYALFLLHFPLLWVVQPRLGNGAVAVVVVCVMNLLYAEFAHRYIERPLWSRFRPYLGKPSPR